MVEERPPVVEERPPVVEERPPVVEEPSRQGEASRNHRAGEHRWFETLTAFAQPPEGPEEIFSISAVVEMAGVRGR